MRYSKIAARLGLAVVLATGLAACSQQDQGPYGGHSPAWYLKHSNEAQKEANWCQHQASEPQPTCKNVIRALDAQAW